MEIDPYLASLNEIADVLAFLFDEGLQYRTIADYSSMLSVLLSSDTTFPIGQHPYYKAYQRIFLILSLSK